MGKDIAALAGDLRTVWSAPTTDARLKKRIVRTVIQRNATSADNIAAIRQLVLIANDDLIGKRCAKAPIPRSS
ncbi:MAG: hypothetical protein EOQ42_32350 [Mesorhizobium sp.]|nr:MAG: hypothetical protein EOQ42_32350 [Mesorhizobium sp.]